MIEYPESLILDSPQIFDSHSHYDDEKFDGLREELLTKLFNSGVCGIISCSVDGISSKNNLALAEKYDNFYVAVGIHPENLDSNTPISEIENFSKHKKCVAIGEIGLDYYWDNVPCDVQKKWFIRQLELAKELDLPVIIHSRDAAEDTLDIMKRYDGKLRGVIHCFSYSKEMAREYVKMGFYIGIGGVVTFKNGKKTKAVVSDIPMDRILLETDCPYLAPEPYRGKRNSSLYLPEIAQAIAEIKGMTYEEVVNQTRENAKTLFRISE